MKRVLFFSALVVFLFILSSCYYSYSDLQEELDKKDEEWSEQYYDLEEKYYAALDDNDQLHTILRKIDESYSTAYCYYDDADPDVTEEEAHAALLQIGDYLREAGY